MNIISQGFPKNKLRIVVSEKTEIARRKINKLILKLLFSCGTILYSTTLIKPEKNLLRCF